MKIIVTVFSVCLFFSSGASAEDKYTWTPMDTYLQSGVVIFTIIDWRQTREFTIHSSKYARKYDPNPFLRGHPSARTANLTAGAAIVIQTGIAYLLPSPYRTIWQSFWIGVEGEAVTANFVAGINVRF